MAINLDALDFQQLRKHCADLIVRVKWLESSNAALNNNNSQFSAELNRLNLAAAEFHTERLAWKILRRELEAKIPKSLPTSVDLFVSKHRKRHKRVKRSNSAAVKATASDLPAWML